MTHGGGAGRSFHAASRHGRRDSQGSGTIGTSRRETSSTNLDCGVTMKRVRELIGRSINKVRDNNEHVANHKSTLLTHLPLARLLIGVGAVNHEYQVLVFVTYQYQKQLHVHKRVTRQDTHSWNAIK